MDGGSVEVPKGTEGFGWGGCETAGSVFEGEFQDLAFSGRYDAISGMVSTEFVTLTRCWPFTSLRLFYFFYFVLE